jgi:hypothetical protein
MSVTHFSKQLQSASPTIPTYPQGVPHLTTKTTGKCLHTGKVNTIDNQPLIYQNT